MNCECTLTVSSTEKLPKLFGIFDKDKSSELNEEEMDIKLAGLDDEDIKNMYPSLRFSSEVS